MIYSRLFTAEDSMSQSFKLSLYFLAYWKGFMIHHMYPHFKFTHCPAINATLMLSGISIESYIAVSRGDCEVWFTVWVYCISQQKQR